MLHQKGKKEPGDATLARVKKEMAKPRMAKSARIAELNLDTARIAARKLVSGERHLGVNYELAVRSRRSQRSLNF